MGGKPKSKIPARKKKVKAPISDNIEFKSITFTISTLLPSSFSSITIEDTESFDRVDPKDINKVFALKCKECSKICDFSIPLKDAEAKDIKSKLLNDIIDGFRDGSLQRSLMPHNIVKFQKMVLCNLCRSFPPINFSLETGDMQVEAAWPHINLVYNSFLAYLQAYTSVDSVQPSLISCVVANACSPDDNERMSAKKVLTALFKKSYGGQIFRCIQNLTQSSPEVIDFVKESSSFIKAPVLPKFCELFRYILGLHNSKDLRKYSFSLSECISKIISIDGALFDNTFSYLSQHWPKSSIEKQLIFLDEIESLILNFPLLLSDSSASATFKILSYAIIQPNVDLADAGVNFLVGPSSEHFLHKFNQACLDLLIPPLFDSARQHWNEYVKGDSVIALEFLSESNSQKFSEVAESVKDEKKKKKTKGTAWKSGWAKIFETARSNDQSIRGINFEALL